MAQYREYNTMLYLHTLHLGVIKKLLKTLQPINKEINKNTITKHLFTSINYVQIM